MASFKKFFAEAEAKGVAPFELRYTKSTELSLEVYQDDLEQNTIASNSTLIGRGMVGGKVGVFESDKVDSKIASLMIDSIKANALFGGDYDESFFISKGLKYKKIKNKDESLALVPSEKLIGMCKDISKKIRTLEPRITVCNVNLSLNSSESVLENSRGLKLKSKGNYLVIYASTKIEVGTEVQSGFNYAIVSSLDEFNVDSFVKESIKKIVDSLGGGEVKSGKYNVIYSQDCAASLLRFMLSNVSAYNVINHLSLLEGKKGQQVLSKKMTLIENPYAGRLTDQSFDDEGIPAKKKVIFSKGVLNDFVYDLDSAKKMNTESSGNAALRGGKVVPSISYFEVKKGKKSFDEIVKSLKKGIYVTSLSGLGTGLNPQSGSYSLQAEGFLIEDGKIVSPIPLMTVAGNILEDFGKVMEVGNDSKFTLNMCSVPSILIKSLSVSGK